MSKSITRNYTRIPFKKGSLGFHMIPYHLQYENRDCKSNILSEPSEGQKLKIEKYVKDFNPYLRFHVSENLGDKVMNFYKYKYNKR